MLLIISLFQLCFSSVTLHEFHISNTEIRHNAEDNALQITSRIFIDDLEEALANYGFEGLNICTKNEVESADSVIANYLSNNFIISIDERLTPFQYLGKEISDDLIAVWCYLEILDISPKEKIEVENNVLMETFGDQKNIVRIKMDEGLKAMYILKKGESKVLVEL